MKKVIYFIILIGFSSCKSQNTNLNGLKNCLEKEEIEVLEMALADFESKLEKKYSGLNTEKCYVKFLEDFIDNNIDSYFFIDPESKMIREKVSEVGIWNLYEESDDEMEAEIRLDGSQPEKKEILTLTHEFQQCMINKTSNEGIRNFLALRSKVPGLSWGLTAKYIYNDINEKALKNKMNRLVIALGIYYEFGLNLDK